MIKISKITIPGNSFRKAVTIGNFTLVEIADYTTGIKGKVLSLYTEESRGSVQYVHISNPTTNSITAGQLLPIHIQEADINVVIVYM